MRIFFSKNLENRKNCINFALQKGTERHVAQRNPLLIVIMNKFEKLANVVLEKGVETNKDFSIFELPIPNTNETLIYSKTLNELRLWNGEELLYASDLSTDKLEQIIALI